MSTAFRCIPAARMFELALKAAQVGGATAPALTTVPPDQHQVNVLLEQREIVLFALGVCEALHNVDYDIDRVGLDDIAKIAKKHAGFQEYDMFADPSGIVDVPRLVASGQKQVFFARYAGAIAGELKRIQGADVLAG